MTSRGRAAGSHPLAGRLRRLRVAAAAAAGALVACGALLDESGIYDGTASPPAVGSDGGDAAAAAYPCGSERFVDTFERDGSVEDGWDAIDGETTAARLEGNALVVSCGGQECAILRKTLEPGARCLVVRQRLRYLMVPVQFHVAAFLIIRQSDGRKHVLGLRSKDGVVIPTRLSPLADGGSTGYSSLRPSLASPEQDDDLELVVDLRGRCTDVEPCRASLKHAAGESIGTIALTSSVRSIELLVGFESALSPVEIRVEEVRVAVE
jgi:hypothetical protein